MQFWQAGQTFPAQLPQLIRKKSAKMQKLFKCVFCKMFLWRIRKQLESPADFLLDSRPKFFRSIFKNQHFVSFLKDFHPKVSIETENPILTTQLIFFELLVKKIAHCPKMKKKIVTKLLFIIMLPWTFRMQFKHLRRKTRQIVEIFFLTV